MRTEALIICVAACIATLGGCANKSGTVNPQGQAELDRQVAQATSGAGRAGEPAKKPGWSFSRWWRETFAPKRPDRPAVGTFRPDGSAPPKRSLKRVPLKRN